MATEGRRPRRGEQGFGLLEVILSLTVLLLVLIASSYLVDNVVQQAAFNRQRVSAAELAEQYLETTSNATLSSLQADISKDVLLTATPLTVGGINYSVWSHLEWAGTGTSPSLCASGNPPQVIRATMTVKWGNGQSMGETSIIDPPYGTVIPGDGFLSIRIYGPTPNKPPADTTNLINVPVTVTPVTTLNTALTTAGGAKTSISVAGLTLPVTNGDSITIGSGSSAQVVTASASHVVGSGTQTISVNSFTPSSTFVAGTAVADAAWGGSSIYNPDQTGCVYLQEPVGKYSVSLASPTGGPSYIDYQEYPTPGVTGQNPVVVTVLTVGLPFGTSFTYDEAGTVTLNPSAGAPLAPGLPITVADGGSLQPGGVNTIVPYGSSTSVVSLFPYTAPYTVWYGDCTSVITIQEQPSAPTPFSLSPRGAATASITGLTTLPITVTRTGNAAFSSAPTATATINDAAAPGDGCPAADKTGGEVYTLAGATPTTVGSTTSYTTQTAIINQTYNVIVHDPSNNSNTPFAMVVGATGVTYNSILYPTGTAVPVVVS
ncbi:MAG TPA: hypothetical protein VII76_02995 [Acidimicrobiales bacterium]